MVGIVIVAAVLVAVILVEEEEEVAAIGARCRIEGAAAVVTDTIGIRRHRIAVVGTTVETMMTMTTTMTTTTIVGAVAAETIDEIIIGIIGARVEIGAPVRRTVEVVGIIVDRDRVHRFNPETVSDYYVMFCDQMLDCPFVWFSQVNTDNHQRHCPWL